MATPDPHILLLQIYGDRRGRISDKRLKSRDILYIGPAFGAIREVGLVVEHPLDHLQLRLHIVCLDVEIVVALSNIIQAGWENLARALIVLSDYGVAQAQFELESGFVSEIGLLWHK